jgi:WD40 repeat protein
MGKARREGVHGMMILALVFGSFYFGTPASCNALQPLPQRPKFVPDDALRGLTHLAISPDGELILSNSENGIISVSDKNGRTIAAHKADLSKDLFLSASVFGPKDPDVVIYATRSRLFAWEWKKKGKPRELGVTDGDGENLIDVPILRLAVSPDGLHVAIIDANQRVLLMDCDSNFVKLSCVRSAQDVQDLPFPGRLSIKYGTLTFSPDSSTLAQTSGNEISLYNLKSRKEVRRLRGHSDIIGSLCFATDNLLLSGSWDGTFRAWDLLHGQSHDIRIRTKPQSCPLVTCSSDAKQCVCVYDDEISVFSLPNREEKKHFRGPKSGVTAVGFLRDPRQLVTSGENPQIQFWDIVEGREIFKK